MKKHLSIIITLLSVGSTAFAGTEKFLCVERSTSEQRGMIELFDENEHGTPMSYFSRRDTSEGWNLLLTIDGRILNNDEMVRQGRNEQVGQAVKTSKSLEMILNTAKLSCTRSLPAPTQAPQMEDLF